MQLAPSTQSLRTLVGHRDGGDEVQMRTIGRDPRSRLDKVSSTSIMSGTKFLHYQLDASRGDAIVVNLDRQANVRVMDSANFDHFRRGERHKYLGGHALKTETRIPIPHSGHWHVAIDLEGAGGTVKASVTLDRTNAHV